MTLIRARLSGRWICLVGPGLTSVVFATFIVCIFIILLNTLAAVMEVEPHMIKAARTLGAGPGSAPSA